MRRTTPGKLTVPLAAAAAMIAVTASACSPSPPPTPDPPPPTPSNSVCNYLTEIADDLNTIQYGPVDNTWNETQALATVLNGATTDTSQEASDFSSLQQDNSAILSTAGGDPSQEQAAIGDAYGDFNALQADCTSSS